MYWVWDLSAGRAETENSIRDGAVSVSKRKYKFTRKRQSQAGIASTAAGVAALLCVASVTAIAYLESGAAGKIIAIPGFLALLLSLLGFVKGIKGIREEDTYRLFPWLGFILNILVLTIFGWIYTMGW